MNSNPLETGERGEASGLPHEIGSRLERLRRNLWRAKSLETVLVAVFFVLAAFGAMFVLDRVADTPVWLRVGLLAVALAVFVFYLPYRVHRWLWRYRRHDDLARLVASAHPRFGDRLLGAVELAAREEDEQALSGVLKRAALRQVAAEAESRPAVFVDSLPKTRNRRWAGLSALCVAGAAASFFFAPEAALNSMQRWLNPFGDIPRFTFTQFEPLPERLVVARGEPFELRLRLADSSRHLPSRASVRVGDDAAFEVERVGRQFEFRFNGVLERQTLAFSAGDSLPQVEVVPLPRPAVVAARAEVRLPDYLQQPPQEVTLADGSFSAVEGSEVMLDWETTRPLARARLSELPADEDDADVFAMDLVIDGQTVGTGDAIEAGLAPQGEESGGRPAYRMRRFQVEFADENGLEASRPFPLAMRVVPDLPPTVFLEAGGREVMILEEETLEYRVSAGDDFGVRRVGMQWVDEMIREVPPLGEVVLAEGGPSMRRLEAEGVFSPESLRLGPRRLWLQAWAEDYHPERARVLSEPVLLVIMDRSEHAEMLRDRFSRLMDRLEEATRRENSNLAENRRIERLPSSEFDTDGTRERVDMQLRAEEANRASIEDLSQDARALFREALRNRDVQAEAMQNWSRLLEELDRIAEEGMPAVENALAQAAAPGDRSGEERKAAAVEAVERQEEVLEMMRQAMRFANRVEQNMEAGAFVTRLRQAARGTDAQATTLREFVRRRAGIEGPTRTAGLESDALERDDYATLAEASADQDALRRRLEVLAEDLGHFYRRTDREVFEQIRSMMVESEILDSYARIAGQMQRNWAGRTVPELLIWAERIHEWADLLDPRSGGSGGGGGGGDGGSEAQGDVELMLQLLRFVQQTQDIQGRTRSIDRRKSEAGGKVIPEREVEVENEAGEANPGVNAPRIPDEA